MARLYRLLSALSACTALAALSPTVGRAQVQATPMYGRCQQCSWQPEYCPLNGEYYDTCSWANVFSGNKICRCLANRRTCHAECEEGGGACQGDASAQRQASAPDAKWAWSERGLRARPSCLAPWVRAVPTRESDVPW